MLKDKENLLFKPRPRELPTLKEKGIQPANSLLGEGSSYKLQDLLGMRGHGVMQAHTTAGQKSHYLEKQLHGPFLSLACMSFYIAQILHSVNTDFHACGNEAKKQDTLTSPASDPSRSKVWRAFAIARMTPCMAGLSITYHGKQEKKHKQERGKQ